jgi:hypothetical protein
MTVKENIWNIMNANQFDLKLFKYLGETIISHVANFTLVELREIEKYLIELTAALTGTNNEGFDAVINLCFTFETELKRIRKQNKELSEYLYPKISKAFKGSRLYNPWKLRIMCGDEEDQEMPYYLLKELQCESRAYHYYLMIYVYDLTLRMQRCKSELIKYELACYKKVQSLPLDCMINELLLEYVFLNKEFMIFNNKLVRCKFRTKSVYIYPNNINIMNHYDKILFDWEKMEFHSVLNEKNMRI